ncbi:MAG TPA: hypothetical protein VLJ84_13255, partial [Usitatibacter sp.]|nr:hypothetical protein [Usitatibacter sp.]
MQALLPVDDPEFAGLQLHQRREAFHPIAVVAIEDPADVADLRLVDVPADHAVEAALARFGRERRLEVADVVDGVLHALLEELRERPVREPQVRARPVEPLVQLQREHVEPVAQVREPLRALHHRVEEVAVDHEEALAV